MMRLTLGPAELERLKGLHEKALELRDRISRDSADLGALLLEIHRMGGYAALGTTTFPLYCEQKLGIGSFDGYRLKAAAVAFEGSPSIRRGVLEERVPFASAAAVGTVYANPALLRGDDRWESLVRELSSNGVRDAVKARRREARMGVAVTRDIQFTPEGWVRVSRAHELVIQILRRPVTLDETMQHVVDDFLERHDPERKAQRALERAEAEAAAAGNGKKSAAAGSATDPGESRRAGLALMERKADRDAAACEAGGPGKRTRHVPSSVRHLMTLQYGDRCWVEGCEERCFLDFAHDRAYALGGGHGRTNLFRYCRTHHRQRDAGMWKEVQGRDGVILVNPRGTVIGRLRRPPPP